MSTLKPLADKVLIRPAKKDRFTESGLELIENWSPQTMGTVQSCGDGAICRKCGTAHPMEVQAGDVVIFPYEAGQTVTIDAEEYLMMKARDILAVVEVSSGG